MSVRTVSHEALKDAIPNVLRSSVLQTINFSYVSPALGGQTLHRSASLLAPVAQRIETGVKIHMRVPCGNDWCYKWLTFDGVPERGL
ncbi:MAG TPA: hypothetical protein VGC97_22945 [Pyrinomonadaceae bacterium]|jgi:hypothetical protein